MMKRLFFFLLAGILGGCYYDNEEELYNCTVDPATIKYSTTITNILTSYGCIGCHSGPAPSGQLDFSTYNGIKPVATDGRLYGAISHSPGYEPMPQGSARMSECNIRKVKAWIDAGAPNN
jgi:hypothetical protein